MVMNKKGYMKILEAVIAIVILILFVTVIIIEQQEDKLKVPQDIYLLQGAVTNLIKEDESIRQNVILGDVVAVKLAIDSADFIPTSNYAYELTLCNVAAVCADIESLGLPTDKEVYAENFIISSTLQQRQETLVGFYLWRINIQEF